MEPLHFITKLLDIKDPNIQIIDIINRDTHKEIIAKLDYGTPFYPNCGSLMKKKDKEKIVNALQLPYSNAKLKAINNLIKLIKRNAFGFRNFENGLYNICSG